MSNQKWREGKTYQFKPDMIEEFKNLNSSNKRIASVIRNDKFTVESVADSGGVLLLAEFSKEDIDVIYWFEPSEIQYFDLIEVNTNNIRPNVDIVVEWLDKLHYVMDKDNSVDDRLYHKPDCLSLTTDFSDISGSNNIYTFITNRYDLLQQEAKHKKNSELMERKAKLEAELAEVNKELGNV